MSILGVFDQTYVSGNCYITDYAYGSTAQASGTITFSAPTPLSNFVVVLSSGATALSFVAPAALFTAVAAAGIPTPLIIGLSRLIRIINTNAGTLTLTIPSGGTVTGVLTIATNTFADFILTITGPATYNVFRCGSGTYP